jgi:23S rRNA pseudouridine1911/1915/1917 synthase
MKKYRVSKAWVGERADKFLASKYPQYARSAVQKLFDKGLVTRDAVAIRGGERLKGGEFLSVDDSIMTAEPPPILIPVVYEDDDVVVIDKPTGVLSHSKGSFNPEATVSSWLRGHVKALGNYSNNRVGIVHRLDRATSGVMICAKHPDAQVWLQKQFSQRNVKKTYMAIVEGHFTDKLAIIDMPIERNPAKPQTFRTSKNGKSAITEYSVLSEINGYSLVELKPTTGRTHQLRVHMKQIGHPIVGDALYGGKPALRLYLHALELELTLPSSERKVFKAVLPQEFTEEF